MPSAGDMLSVRPTYPDFYVCAAEYGTGLSRYSCYGAAARLERGTRPVAYVIRRSGLQHFQFSLPVTIYNCGCWISIEAAGPTTGSFLTLTPNDLCSMAAWVIQACVVEANGQGGFVTGHFSNLIDEVTDPALILSPSSYFPTASQFVTLTIHGPSSRLPSPGNTDPSIPVAVGQAIAQAATKGTQSTTVKFMERALVWLQSAAGMSRTGQTAWWTEAASPDEMTYECDADLGSPLLTECTQIEWNQLGPASVSPPSDTVTVGPGVVQFLHSNSCYLAISATATIALSWQQIRAAVATLMNICVQHPFQPAQGGRAYYRPPATDTRQRKKRNQNQNQISGLNALPLHANITIFQQREPWTNAAEELKSCTWDAVLNERSVLTCKA